jgi:hypothetical protein
MIKHKDTMLPEVESALKWKEAAKVGERNKPDSGASLYDFSKKDFE